MVIYLNNFMFNVIFLNLSHSNYLTTLGKISELGTKRSSCFVGMEAIDRNILWSICFSYKFKRDFISLLYTFVH